jgi:hypothetical protein
MRLRAHVMAGVAGVLLALPASAFGQHAAVRLQLPSSGNAGVATPFQYSATGVPRHASVTLQRPEGTRHVWQTIASLKAGTHTGSLPALSVGTYSVRVAVLTTKRVHVQQKVKVEKAVVAQSSAVIGIFGQVPLTTLLGESSTRGVYTTPTATFPYAFDSYDGRVNYTDLEVNKNPCRSVTLTWVEGAEYDDSQQSGTVTLVQESADPVSATAAGNAVGTLSASLVPGQAWSVNVAQSQGDPTSYLFTWYFNGTADCDATKLSDYNIDPGGF